MTALNTMNLVCHLSVRWSGTLNQCVLIFFMIFFAGVSSCTLCLSGGFGCFCLRGRWTSCQKRHREAWILWVLQCIQLFPQNLFVFKKSVSCSICLKFSEKNPSSILFPKFVLRCSFGVVNFKVKEPAEFRFFVRFHGNVPCPSLFHKLCLIITQWFLVRFASNFQERLLVPSSNNVPHPTPPPWLV